MTISRRCLELIGMMLMRMLMLHMLRQTVLGMVVVVVVVVLVLLLLLLFFYAHLLTLGRMSSGC